MRARDPRQKVLLDARLRQDCGWSDARILNISRRGLMVRAGKIPPRGSYVEICRGTHRIVARVVWVNQDRFGARAQESIHVDAIVSGTEPAPVAANSNHERRAQPRKPGPGSSHERSRHSSRRMEFAAVTLFAVAAAIFVFDTVSETLAKPLTLVEKRLGGSG